MTDDDVLLELVPRYCFLWMAAYTHVWIAFDGTMYEPVLRLVHAGLAKPVKGSFGESGGNWTLTPQGKEWLT